jgi:glycosyltransferase involved in cell wall biosynthesis
VFYDVQTPDVFLRGLKAFLGSRPEAAGRVEADFVGLVPEASERLIASLGLENVANLHGYLPHRDAVQWLGRADVLWLTVGRRPGAEGISTGKLFEYMGAAKPILALVPEGEVRTTLAPYGAAFLADPDDEEEVAGRLEEVWTLWREGRLPAPDPAYIARFDRRTLARRLAGILDEASEEGR